MQGRKTLITGGLGFIGREIARILVEHKHSVILFDNLSAQIHGAVPALHGMSVLMDERVDIVRGDVCREGDWEKVLADVGCIIHLAAETGTAQSMYEIARYAETNVYGTASLLNHLTNHKHNVSKFILASSRSVYGEGAYICSRCGVVYPPSRSLKMFQSEHWQPDCPICGGPAEAAATREDAKTAPASIYAATKLAQEDLVRIAGQAIGVPTVIFRFQNVYGEGQSLKNPYTGILSIFSNQFRANRNVYLYEDGQESRDFIHVSDVGRAVVAAVELGGGDGCTLNVGSGDPTTVEDVAFLLRERFGASTKPIVSGQSRAGDIRHGYADISAIVKCLGFTPQVPIELGMDRFVAWVKTQEIEPDRLHVATEQLVSRGLMEGHGKLDATLV